MFDRCDICDKPFGDRPAFPPDRPVYHDDCLDRETAWVRPVTRAIARAAMKRTKGGGK